MKKISWLGPSFFAERPQLFVRFSFPKHFSKTVRNLSEICPKFVQNLSEIVRNLSEIVVLNLSEICLWSRADSSDTDGQNAGRATRCSSSIWQTAGLPICLLLRHQNTSSWLWREAINCRKRPQIGHICKGQKWDSSNRKFLFFCFVLLRYRVARLDEVSPIGLLFNCWLVKNYRKGRKMAFLHWKRYVPKCIGLHFGRFPHKLIWSPRTHACAECDVQLLNTSINEIRDTFGVGKKINVFERHKRKDKNMSRREG
jgi:hypothetical protein